MTWESILLGVLSGCLLGQTAYVLGRLVEAYRLDVETSRKIVHTMNFLVPVGVFAGAGVTLTPTSAIPTLGLLLGGLVVISHPRVRRHHLTRPVLAAFERVEDGAHSVGMIVSQDVAALGIGWIVWRMLPPDERGPLALLLVIPMSLGDGLAAVVGKRYGKLRYRVPSLTSGRRYSRSVEGSACIFAVSAFSALLLRQHLSDSQFLIGITVLPPALTLAEAASPHSWDTPAMALIGGLVLIAVA